MRDRDNIFQIASFAPDYLGFIFHPASPRFVGENFTMPKNLPASIKKVGVFVNESTETIIQLAKTHGFDVVQLHGNETVAQSATLRASGLKVIKAFSLDNGFNFIVTKPFVTIVDYFLFDTKGKHFGGNATTFNWEILKHYDQEAPFFLSGGLSAQNVGQVSSLMDMNLYALDINSGVEEMPGVKSPEKLKILLANLKTNEIG